MAPRENRRQNRQVVPGRIKLHWSLADGCSAYATGECLDISNNGMRVKMDQRIELGRMVRVESAQFHIVGVAYVRHCRAQGMKFVVGVEFTGGLKWNQQKPV